MKKRSVLALFSLMLAVGTVGVYAAGQTAPPSLKADFEMRKNIAWTVEGLYQLGKNKNRALKLTAAQAKKILPLYKELIAKKIINLKLEEEKSEGHGGPPPGSFEGAKGGPPAGGGGGAPRQYDEKRMRERAALVTFGNAKMEAINRILTKKQVEFIDNWDFEADKYGIPNTPNRPGGQGQFDGSPPGDGPIGNNAPGSNKMSRPERGSRPGKSKLEAGRKLLVKLNQDVLKMLQNYK